jgi:hypothetical protein
VEDEARDLERHDAEERLAARLTEGDRCARPSARRSL